MQALFLSDLEGVIHSYFSGLKNFLNYDRTPPYFKTIYGKIGKLEKLGKLGKLGQKKLSDKNGP